jgi:hypothetical protein
MFKICCLCFGLCVTTSAQVPITNLILLELSESQKGLDAQNPIFLTDFNKAGYNNQPRFFSDDVLYFTMLIAGGKQTDIYAFRFSDSTMTQITDTPESEYSAKLANDRNSFNCIRVDVDSTQIQRIWEYPVDRTHSGGARFSSITNAGYYHFKHPDTMAAFLVTSPPELSLFQNTASQKQTISKNIGRCLEEFSNSDLAFVHKYSEKHWFLKRYIWADRKSEILIEMPAGSEDFVILNDESILSASGSTLYRWHFEKTQNRWDPVADFSVYGWNKVSRLSVNPSNNLLVIVVEQ